MRVSPTWAMLSTLAWSPEDWTGGSRRKLRVQPEKFTGPAPGCHSSLPSSSSSSSSNVSAQEKSVSTWAKGTFHRHEHTVRLRGGREGNKPA